MRQLSIKKEIIKDVLDECGYFETPNGWVKYIDGARFNLERFHYKDGKLHLDGIKNGKHVVRRDMVKGSFEKYLMDNELENIEIARKEITDKLRRKNVLQDRLKLKVAYAPNLIKLQKQVLNPPKKPSLWARFKLWISFTQNKNT